MTAATGTPPANNVLIDRTNTYINAFSAHPLHAVGLRNDLLSRAEQENDNNNNSNNNSSGLGKSTSQTENYTSYTNLSDQSNYNTLVDPTDLKKLDADLEVYKSYYSKIKLQWLESNIKKKWLVKLLDPSMSAQIITQQDCETLEQQRGPKKEAITALKDQADQLRSEIGTLGKEVDEGLAQKLTPAIEEVRTLTREIQDMELELAMLRNSRPEEERMTVSEANQSLDDQIVALQSLAQSLQESRAKIEQQKQTLVSKQKEFERLNHEKVQVAKMESEARNAIRNKDKRIEETCRQLLDRSTLMNHLLGIKEVQPCPNGELRVLYDLSGGKTATLAIYSDVQQRRLKGARLLESNIAIDDIVTRCAASNDLQGLVLEVLVRIT